MNLTRQLTVFYYGTKLTKKMSEQHNGNVKSPVYGNKTTLAPGQLLSRLRKIYIIYTAPGKPANFSVVVGNTKLARCDGRVNARAP